MGYNVLKPPTKNESRIIKFMILLGIFSIINFLIFFFQPKHAGETWIFVLLTITILYSILKKLYMWYNYSNISIPEKPEGKVDFTVDILTTYYPGEPYQMTITTLEAIINITYPHTTYLCDEANDPFLKEFCKENGIIHVARDNRINAKAGNINNALRKYATGDICVVLDPDHIPEPNFLDSILPHFINPEIGFVQIVQSYYNIKETLVARGAAEQTFQFYGPMMMTLNAYGAVNAIGANCVFRRKALDSIGGHAPGLCEDMHTAMLLYAEGWKAVYVPEVLARGLAPSNLTSFFKQQIKWSRGTFDLLVKVYPKIFLKLTGRQKIHYGVLPMHYFAGVTCLINFLIPIFSLLFSITPWRGSIIDFALVLLPVAASSILVRTFIQKWVIEKKERGFHLVGGLLHINSWWVYLLGLIFTIINKNVPYLPTPKENEWNTNYKIVIPNMVVAALSIFAVIYGLQKDLTPYSLIMAGFALFNAIIMIFGVYLAHRVTNQNQILRSKLQRKNVKILWSVKEKFYEFANVLFYGIRKISLPLLLAIVIASMGFKNENELSKWEKVKAPLSHKHSPNYLGIFHPYSDSGLSDLSEIEYIENSQDVNFNIISFYLGWNTESLNSFPHELMKGIYNRNAIPMITWEPWASALLESENIEELKSEKKIFKYISEGSYDDYIRSFVQILKSYDEPIFLRFAHEFDNPQYPWSQVGDNTPEEFISAWKHVHEIVQEEGARKIIFVWNPWSIEGMSNYYPGHDFVDWIGVTLLNYDSLNKEGENFLFKELYEPIKAELKTFTNKPVILTEFGSIDVKKNQESWTKDAFVTIKDEYPDILGVVMFNSAFDKNIPDNKWYKEKYLDWTSNQMAYIGDEYKVKPTPNNISLSPANRVSTTIPISSWNIRGINYKKAKRWKNNYYNLSKDVLEKDFHLIQNAGLNTIKINSNNIYDYNLFKYSKEFGLSIIYQFEASEVFDYITDRKNLTKSKDKILKKVRDFKDDSNIIGYTFVFDLDNYFHKPDLYAQEKAYLNWLGDLLTEIKSIDPSKLTILEIDHKKGRETEMKWIYDHLSIDAFGLRVTDTIGLNQLFQYTQEKEVPLFISDIDNDVFVENAGEFKDHNFILSNFQDEHYSNWVTFDGLIDIYGNPRFNYASLKNALKEKEEKAEAIIFKILLPSVPLLPENALRYHVYAFKNQGWFPGSNLYEEYEYEWSLVQTDDYGNPIAVKHLGNGHFIDVIIPEKYNNFRLMLTSIHRLTGLSTNSFSTLNTPTEIKN